jgi:hypothetical protein
MNLLIRYDCVREEKDMLYASSGSWVKLADIAKHLNCAPDAVLDTIEALKRDAARYRWIIDAPATHQSDIILRKWLWSRPGVMGELTEIIDAAMQADKED